MLGPMAENKRHNLLMQHRARESEQGMGYFMLDYTENKELSGIVLQEATTQLLRSNLLNPQLSLRTAPP